MTLRSPLLALALLVGATSFADAQTAPMRDSVVIRNSTTIPITYSTRFNGGEWMTWVLQPGDSRAHFSTLTLPSAPRVEVRFADLIPYDDVIQQDVNTSFVSNPHSAISYQFRVMGGRLYLVR